MSVLRFSRESISSMKIMQGAYLRVISTAYRFARHFEEFANALRSDAHEDVLEFGRRDEEERHARFAGHGARHQRFAGPRRAGQQHAARRCGAERVEHGGILREKGKKSDTRR